MSVVDFHGKQVIADLFRCVNNDPLNDERMMVDMLCEIATRHGASVEGVISKKFVPCGLTAVIGIGESHISIHTWPETSDAMLDVCTCGSINSVAIAQAIVDWLCPEDIRWEEISRGRRTACQQKN